MSARLLGTDPARPVGPVPAERYAIAGLRASLVLVFLIFGLQKFTAAEAQGITEALSG